MASLAPPDDALLKRACTSDVRRRKWICGKWKFVMGGRMMTLVHFDDVKIKITFTEFD